MAKRVQQKKPEKEEVESDEEYEGDEENEAKGTESNKIKTKKADGEDEKIFGLDSELLLKTL